MEVTNLQRLVAALSIAALTACASDDTDRGKPSSRAVDPAATAVMIGPLSGAETLDLSVAQPDPRTHLGFDDSSTGTYNATNMRWELSKPGDTLKFHLNIPWKVPVQLAMSVGTSSTGVSSANGFTVAVNEWSKSSQPETAEFWPMSWGINQDKMVAGKNSISITLDKGASGPIYVNAATVIPRKLYAQHGALTTELFAQFSLAEIDGLKPSPSLGARDDVIWTRAYGLTGDVPMIPAPVLYYKPGDMLNVRLRNLLNPESNAVLEQFEKTQNENLASNNDEIMEMDHFKHEINIPHNLNNTNLHVHGLHVDPSKDDVTVVITPASGPDSDVSDYDAPATDGPGPSTDFNAGSVSDQSVKQGQWDYNYAIPTDHLPGTHWYHPHKHGSTAAQVENGLAGSMVIVEDESNSVVPFPEQDGQPDYDRQSWANDHDRVLLIQEINNFGVQEGEGNALGAIQYDTAQITVNGEVRPQISIGAGQLERWRLINGGANHQTFAHIWLGKKTRQAVQTNYTAEGCGKGGTKTQADCAPPAGYLPPSCTDPGVNGCEAVYESVEMHAVAVDGITMAAFKTVTAQKPLLLAPGNRTDVLVDLSDAGDYALFKYFPNATTVKTASGAKSIVNINYTYPKSSNKPSGTATAQYAQPLADGNTLISSATASNGNPYLFTATGVGTTTGSTSYPANTNYAGYVKKWVPGTNGSSSLFPLIRPTPPTDNPDGALIDVTFALTSEFTTSSGDAGKWQPLLDGTKGGGGGTPDPEVLMSITVSGTASGSPTMPSQDHLASVSANNMQNPPAYVSSIADTDVLQSRPMIFDVAGLSVNVTQACPKSDPGCTPASTGVNQFTLNGRPFELNDPVGNPEAPTIVSSPTAIHPGHGLEETVVTPGTAKSEFSETLTFVAKSTKAWDTSGDPEKYWVNPSYYRALTGDDATGWQLADYSEKVKPTWASYTGIPEVSIVNQGASKYIDAVGPGQPYATTGEEWVLINNSDVAHPFHIHINPFFVTEVGQLSYETFGNVDEWVMRVITNDTTVPDSLSSAPTKPTKLADQDQNMQYVVDNWWDTIAIPPHGYVKLRYWMNVPKQVPITTNPAVANVLDNYNREGVWVFHCHILRHEDRGMMLPVVTRVYPDDEAAE